MAGMVNVGGMTRLTKSGLSMTTWKPFGSLPPIGEDEWRIEFERYKVSFVYYFFVFCLFICFHVFVSFRKELGF